VPVPIGCGRPIWVDDPTYCPDRHVSVVTADPTDDVDVLRSAVDLVMAPLATDRPLWSARILTGVTSHRAVLIVVVHHVLANGVAGLTLLAGLADGAPNRPDVDFPRPAPSSGQLRTAAFRAGLLSVGRLPAGLARLASGTAVLMPALRSGATACSLNQPTGPERRLAIVRCDLSVIRDRAHRDEATVNDVLLAAVTGALHTVLLRRGELLSELVVSVPFSSRSDADNLGHHSGVIPLRLPAAGPFDERLRATVAITRAAKRAGRGTSISLLGPAFRVLAALGLYERLITHQRHVHTVVSDLEGPTEPLTIAGHRICRIIPLSTTTGNLTVAVTALSYAGVLTVAVMADPSRCPDLSVLQDALAAEFRAVGQSPTVAATAGDRANDTGQGRGRSRLGP
jgi:WS/DGAT/MGAT family acyltransferase